MKTFLKVLLGIVIGIVLVAVLALGYLGYIPGLSDVMGANKPRDLGVTYTQADKDAARAKSQIEYTTLPANETGKSIQYSGVRPVNNSWSSAEMTALMNNRPWKYWPIKNVQLKINSDGTAELSGIVMRDKLQGYGAGIGAPAEVADTIVKFLPPAPAFYLKGKAALTNNNVSTFDIQSAQLGKVSIPTSTLLSFGKFNLASHALANDIAGELNKYSGKKEAVVNFINERLSAVSGFFTKSAHFQDGKLFFDGTLPEKELTVR